MPHARITSEPWSDTDDKYTCTGCGASVVGEGPQIQHTDECILNPKFRERNAARRSIKGKIKRRK